VTRTAISYLIETHDAMRDRYIEHCVAHACAIAELLVTEGRAAWIARLREVVVTNDGEFHAPLIPKRFTGANALTWNTHYVACADNEAFDPILGEPIAIDAFALAVFGRDVPIETHLDAAETKRLIAAGALRRAFPPHSRRTLAGSAK